MPTHLPLVLSPAKHPPVLHFLKECILVVHGYFPLVFQANIYQDFIKFTPHYLLFLYHHVPLIVNILQKCELSCMSFSSLFLFSFSFPLCYFSLIF
jgi:hypothetical protein